MLRLRTLTRSLRLAKRDGRRGRVVDLVYFALHLRRFLVLMTAILVGTGVYGVAGPRH